MSFVGIRYEIKCTSCNSTWACVGADKAKEGCPVCNKRRSIIAKRVESMGNYNHPNYV